LPAGDSTTWRADVERVARALRPALDVARQPRTQRPAGAGDRVERERLEHGAVGGVSWRIATLRVARSRDRAAGPASQRVARRTIARSGRRACLAAPTA
jgi:hypothetical protein